MSLHGVSLSHNLVDAGDGFPPINIFVLFALIAVFALVNKNVADGIGVFLTNKL